MRGEWTIDLNREMFDSILQLLMEQLLKLDVPTCQRCARKHVYTNFSYKFVKKILQQFCNYDI